VEGVVAETELGRDFLLVALFTGMRRSEIARLRWEEVLVKEPVATRIEELPSREPPPIVVDGNEARGDRRLRGRR
jgi:integrase